MNVQTLIDEAKERMLTSGSVMPMLYLELSQDVILFALDILSDTQSIPAQMGMLARLGWEECKKYPGQTPRRCGFYTEGWQLRNPERLEDALMPVNSKKREEVLLVSLWQAEAEPQKQLYSLPVIRDHKGRVVDVGTAEPEATIPHQLAAFVQGVRDSQKPDAEVFARLNRALTSRLAHLTDAQREELKTFLRREGLEGMV